jgi:hypothetical protein
MVHVTASMVRISNLNPPEVQATLLGGHFVLRHHHGAAGGAVHVETFEMKKSKDLESLMRAVVGLLYKWNAFDP